MQRKFSIPPALYALLFYVLFIVLYIISLKKIPLLSAPILFSVIVSYLFSPTVNYFERKTKLPRGIIAGTLILLLVILFVFLIVSAFPYLISRVDIAAQKLPGVIKQFSESVRVFGDYLTRNFSEYIGKVDLMGAFSDWLNDSLSGLVQVLINSFGSIYGILSIILYLVLVPLFSFYFLKDQGKIEKTFYGLVPEAYRWRMRRKMIKIDRVLSSFIRGQAIVILILAILYSTGLKLLGLPFAILIGIFSGFGDIIPYFGTIVGYSISMIVGFVHFNSIKELLLITLIYAVVKGSENWFFYPKIVGREVGLHFVWVLVSIIVFGQLFGFWGLLFAIPSSAVFRVFVEDLIKQYKKSDFYTQ